MKSFAAFVMVSLAVAGCGKPPDSGDSADQAKPVVQVTIATAEKGDIQETVEATGTLAPLPGQEAKVAPLSPGRIKDVRVKIGDTVTKGQVLATIDAGALAGQVGGARSAVQAAREALAQAQINLDAERRSQQAAVEQAHLNVRAQTVALAKLRAGSRPQEIAQAQAAVSSAQAAVTNAVQNLSRSQTLYGEGLLARKDLESAQAQVETAKAQLASAEQALSLAKQGNRPEDIQAGEVALDQARQQLRAAQAQSVQVKSKEQDVQIARQQVASATASLQSIVAQYNALTIVSPVGGTVVARAVNPGESVDTTTAIVTVVNLDRVRLLLHVAEGSLAKLRPGQAVEFTTDAAPGSPHRAVLSVIGSAIDPASNTVEVEAVADNSDHRLRDDGFVTAKIVTKSVTGVVLVPVTAVVQKGGQPTVFTVGQDDVAHANKVVLGVTDPNRTEVVKGVSSGDRVVTTGALELEDGTATRTAK